MIFWHLHPSISWKNDVKVRNLSVTVSKPEHYINQIHRHNKETLSKSHN